MRGDACGRHPVNGLLWLARRKGMQGRILDLRNSRRCRGPEGQRGRVWCLCLQLII